ncbi:MAG: hypothetical protein ACYC5O_24200, partial [Anaerolineae bacterium]
RPTCPAGVAWRQATHRDRHDLVGIANAMASYEVQRLRAVGLRAFDDDDLLGPVLARLGLGQPRPRRVLVRSERVVGGVALSGSGSPARIVALIRPDEEGQVVECLAAEAATLRPRTGDALCDVSGGTPSLVASLESAGFEPVDDLLHMALDLTRAA